jgi:hypothetical protein
MLSFLIFPSVFSQYQHCIFPRCIVAQHRNTLLLLYVELGISLYLLVYFRCQFSLYFNICLVPTISTHVLNVVVDAPFLLLLLILYPRLERCILPFIATNSGAILLVFNYMI